MIPTIADDNSDFRRISVTLFCNSSTVLVGVEDRAADDELSVGEVIGASLGVGDGLGLGTEAGAELCVG